MWLNSISWAFSVPNLLWAIYVLHIKSWPGKNNCSSPNPIFIVCDPVGPFKRWQWARKIQSP